MEPNENQQLNSYFNHPISASNAAINTNNTLPSPSNGLLPTNDGTHMVYPHSVPSAVTSPLEPARRKRGRPRKYGTPEQALAARKAGSSSNNASSAKEKREQQAVSASSPSSYSGSSRKAQLAALGNAGQGFAPHVITVAAGEDVGQKIMNFMQQSKREICILSASGSISNASLRQPASSGGNISYEGRFEIISLSGSYIRTDVGGRTGGLSICMSTTDGQIIGGGVGGPLKAAGPVQVIVSTFTMDIKKDTNGVAKGDASGNKYPSPIGGGTSMSNMGFHLGVESSSRNQVRANDDHQTMGGNPFLIQSRGMHMTPSRPSEWGSGPDGSTTGYDFSGRTSRGPHQSPENGDYNHLQD